MNEETLPKGFQDRLSVLMGRFAVLSSSAKERGEELIPLDKEFHRDVAFFMIDVIEHILSNYDSVDIEAFRQFLAGFHYNFYYGPSGDNYNYLDSDIQLDGESMAWFCWDLKQSYDVPKEKLEAIMKKYTEVSAHFMF
jgi:hypothetical protein